MSGKDSWTSRSAPDVVRMCVGDEDACRLDLFQHGQVWEPVADIDPDAHLDQRRGRPQLHEHAGCPDGRSYAQELDPPACSSPHALPPSHMGVPMLSRVPARCRQLAFGETAVGREGAMGLWGR